MGVSDIAQINPEVGGVLYFQGVSLNVNNSFFEGNTGFKGGALYITPYNSDVQQDILIYESYFKGNRGNVGGAINFSINLKMMEALIAFCIFNANNGKSRIFYFF